jgi:hypothetical protein
MLKTAEDTRRFADSAKHARCVSKTAIALNPVNGAGALDEPTADQVIELSSWYSAHAGKSLKALRI